MPIKPSPRARRAGLLALCAVALAACAGPGAIPAVTPVATPAPTAAATLAPPPAATALPTIAAAIPATSATLAGPSGVAFDAAGNMLIAACGIMTGGPQLIRIDGFGLRTVIASPVRGGFTGDGGPALGAEISCAMDVAVNAAGNIYVADSQNHRIRRIDRAGLIVTVAGSGPASSIAGDAPAGSYAGDGSLASQARLNLPNGLALDPAGNLYIADSGNNRIRKVDRRGIITTIAGTGEPGYSGDGGPAAAAQLYLHVPGINNPSGLALDVQGNLYLSDSENNRVRKIDPQGIITTVAGTGQPGTAGDGGPAAAAQLHRPSGLAIGPDGSLYISNDPTSFLFDSRVRKIDPNGIITSVAGAGGGVFGGDGGPATTATLNGPMGLALDAAGNLYIADFGNDRIRRVDARGTIDTVVGWKP